MKNCIETHFNIVFIGAGRVAWHLAWALHCQGHKIVQVYSRTNAAAEALSQRVGAEPIVQLSQITQLAHFYIYCVPDDALAATVARVNVNSGVHLHTSGSTDTRLVFHGNKQHFGCLYPLHSFSKEAKVDFHRVPLFIEADNDKSFTRVNDLCRSISQKIYPLSSERRLRLHLASVMACNFSNLMMIEAENILASENIPFEVMHNLITEMVNKIKKIGPTASITGPAARGDERTIARHLSLLSSKPQLHEIYAMLSEQIKNHTTSNEKS